MTIMGIAADKAGLDIKGAQVRVEKTMVADPHRRIDSLQVEVSHLPASMEAANRKVLEDAGRGCPVHHTLRPDTRVELTFRWDG
jgi:uncharacterized OsmC-like protein